jgi:hypothetical protein
VVFLKDRLFLTRLQKPESFVHAPKVQCLFHGITPIDCCKDPIEHCRTKGERKNKEINVYIFHLPKVQSSLKFSFSHLECLFMRIVVGRLDWKQLATSSITTITPIKASLFRCSLVLLVDTEEQLR